MSREEAEQVRRKLARSELEIVRDREGFATHYLLCLSRIHPDDPWPPMLESQLEQLMAKRIARPQALAFELAQCERVIKLVKASDGRAPYLRFPREVVNLWVLRQNACAEIVRVDREIAKLMNMNETDLVEVSEQRLEGEVPEEDRELFKL